MKKIFLIVILALVIGCVVYYFIGGIHYSDGNRSGILRKFSHKGIIFKTYEGELMIGGCRNNSSAPEVFYFSADKNHPETIDSLNNWNGRCVSLHYDEVYKNFPWQGDTKYFVDKVKLESN